MQAHENLPQLGDVHRLFHVAGDDEAAPGGEPAAPEDRPVQLRLLGELRITAGGQEVSGGLRKDIH